MKGQIQKWGNSLALRIPRSLAQEAGLTQSTPVEICASGDGLIITPLRPARYALEDLLARIEPEQLHAETPWGTAQGQEEW